MILLKENDVAAYPVRVMFLNFTKQFCRYLIDDGHTLGGLFPVSLPENTSIQRNAFKSVDVGEPPNSSTVFFARSFS